MPHPTAFGDEDPEDAWDDGDARELKVAILVRLVLSIALERSHPAHDHPRIVARIAFGIWQTERLLQKAKKAERPPLEALALVFAHLNELEGP